MERRDGILTRRVSVAVLVLDDFTDRVLSGAAIQVRATGLPAKPIRKSDGYFVFTTDQGTIRQIEVDSLSYEKEIVTVEPEALNPLHPVIKVRLKPNRQYASPGAVTCLEGRAEPGCEIRVIQTSNPQPLKLLYDYEKTGGEAEREIRIFHPEKKDLSGRTLAIQSQDQKEPEVFRVLEMTDREQGVCLLTKALSKAYKKIGAMIFPVYTTRANEKGEFFLLLPGLTGREPGRCRVQAVDKKTIQVESDLTPGKTNRLDLLKPGKGGK
jgi:hypothetical protein